jgi:Xaa-Pro aminopeptidase
MQTFSQLDNAIQKSNAAAYVCYAPPNSPDMRYLTGFSGSDPLVCIKRPNEVPLLIVPQMEYNRACAETKCEVITRGDAGFFNILEQRKNPNKALAEMIAAQVKGSLLVSSTFPLGLARDLEEHVAVHIDKGTLGIIRERKTKQEIAAIESVQRRTEQAFYRAVQTIQTASARGTELYIGEELLTSEHLRRQIECDLLTQGCRAEETIVSCAIETGMPHCLGSGPLLLDEPILMDIFPHDSTTGYYADMSRTVCRGTPSREIKDLYALVQEAKQLGTTMLRPGITGQEIHNAVVSFFEEAGHPTGEEGFTHSLGHGVGLAIHEGPSLSPSGGLLAPGNVVTIEPGLYYRDIGGVRLEDLAVVTEERCRLLTNCKEELCI